MSDRMDHNYMEDETKTDVSRLIAMILIGAGLIAIGIMFMLLLNAGQNASASSSDLSAVPAEMDYPSPELELTTLDGAPVSLKQLQGNVVLVNLWATWCPPCRQEMPALQTFYEQYKNKDFILIAVNQEETREVVESFVNEYKLTFPIWLDKDYLAQRQFHTANLPSSYVIDREGRVKLLWIGAISAENLEKFVTKIILE